MIDKLEREILTARASNLTPDKVGGLTPKGWGWVVAICFAIALLMITFGSPNTNHSNTNSHSSSNSYSSRPPAVTQLNVNAVLCLTKDDTYEVNMYLRQDDRKAAAMMILEGRCLPIPAGTTVHVMKYGMEWDLVRLDGTTTKLWALDKWLRR